MSSSSSSSSSSSASRRGSAPPDTPGNPTTTDNPQPTQSPFTREGGGEGEGSQQDGGGDAGGAAAAAAGATHSRRTSEASAAGGLVGDEATLDLLRSLEDSVLRGAQATISAVRREGRMSRLQWGRANASFDEFEYYDAAARLMKSKQVVSRCLRAFLMGDGCYISGFSTTFTVSPGGGFRFDAEANEADAQRFHNKLVDQIHGLIGETPEVRKMEDGRYAIFLPE